MSSSCLVRESRSETGWNLGPWNNCINVQLGEILDKNIKKKKKKKQKNPSATSEEQGEKTVWEQKCCLHSTPPEGWAKHLSHPSRLTHGHALPLTPIRNKLAAPSAEGASKEARKPVCSHLPPPCCSRDPNKALPAFLVWPRINFY